MNYDQEARFLKQLIECQEQLAQCTCDIALALRSIDKNLYAIEQTLKKLVPQPQVAQSATLTLHAN